jgi:hypothetical protein
MSLEDVMLEFPEVVDVGTHEIGKTIYHPIKVTNRSDEEIVILGGNFG